MKFLKDAPQSKNSPLGNVCISYKDLIGWTNGEQRPFPNEECRAL